MATATLLSVNEYLRSSYEPDAEFVDGRIEERSVGGIKHSALQRQLLLLLSKEIFLAHFVCYPELRVQTLANHFRLPDLCLVSPDAPWDEIVQVAPKLCIEILSPDDSMTKTLVRVREFLAMGVPEVWVFDPETRIVHLCTRDGIVDHCQGDLAIPHTLFHLSIGDVFAVLKHA